jgi:hypothetical protein
MDAPNESRLPLDPARLTPAASLNRVRFSELPGLDLPADLVGRNAYWLLGAHALAELTRDVAEAAPSDDAARHDREVARRYGERLGWLLVTLRRGDLASREARPDWDASYWQRWASLTTVFLAGGIVDGPLGGPITAQAAETLTRAGHPELTVRTAHWPAVLPLIGAARAARGPFQEAVAGMVFDFGGSFVKRAHAQYRGGRLVGLRLLAPVPARWTVPSAGREPTLEETAHLAHFIVTTLAETWEAVRARTPLLSTDILISLASYIRDGQPLARQGGTYAALHTIADDLPGWLGEQVSRAVGTAVAVYLLHDGTAAATALADEPNVSVIMLGTALGVGYPPGYGSAWPCSLPLLTVDAEPS